MHKHFYAPNSVEMLRFEQDLILTIGLVKYGHQVKCLIVRAEIISATSASQQLVSVFPLMPHVTLCG